MLGLLIFYMDINVFCEVQAVFKLAAETHSCGATLPLPSMFSSYLIFKIQISDNKPMPKCWYVCQKTEARAVKDEKNGQYVLALSFCENYLRLKLLFFQCKNYHYVT